MNDFQIKSTKLNPKYKSRKSAFVKLVLMLLGISSLATNCATEGVPAYEESSSGSILSSSESSQD